VANRVLFRGGHVLTMDPQLGDVHGGDVLVEDDRIAAVGSGIEAGDAEVVDTTGCIVIPGFIDSHRHTWETVIRGIAPDVSLGGYFEIVLDQLAPAYRPEDVYAGNYLGSLEAIDAGVTTLLDWSHISNTPEHSDEAVHGLQDAGIRGVYAHGIPGDNSWWAYSDRGHPEDIRRIQDRYFSSDDQLLTLAMAARAVGNVTPETAQHDWALARELGIRITVHVGMRLTGVHVHHILGMHEAGVMGPDTTYIHCTDSTDEELDLIAETGGTVSIASYVELLMGHGRPPTGRLLERGVRPSLSVDVVSSVPGEMFTQMRTALVYERILAFTDTPDEPFAPKLTHRDVLQFATIEGARACGLDDKVGSLTPGKQADFILLRTDMVNVAPLIDPVTTAVVFADTSNVDSVFVAGKPVKRNGELVGHDLQRAFGLLEQSRDYLLTEAGMLPDWVGAPVTA